MIHRYGFAMALALGVASPVQATDRLSYSHFDFGYVNGDIEADDSPESFDGDGLRFGVGVGLGRWFNFVGEYDQRRYDDLRRELEFGAAGFGVHTLHPDYQFQLEATWEHFGIDTHGNVADDTKEGYGVAAGVRVPLPSLELQASYKYIDWNDYELEGAPKIKHDGSRLRGGFVLQLSPWWSLVAEYQQTKRSLDDAEETLDEWTVGFRRYFATDADKRKRHGGVLFGDEIDTDTAAEESAAE